MTSLDRDGHSTGGRRPFGALDGDRGYSTDHSGELTGGLLVRRITDPASNRVAEA